MSSAPSFHAFVTAAGTTTAQQVEAEVDELVDELRQLVVPTTSRAAAGRPAVPEPLKKSTTLAACDGYTLIVSSSRRGHIRLDVAAPPGNVLAFAHLTAPQLREAIDALEARHQALLEQEVRRG